MRSKTVFMHIYSGGESAESAACFGKTQDEFAFCWVRQVRRVEHVSVTSIAFYKTHEAGYQISPRKQGDASVTVTVTKLSAGMSTSATPSVTAICC